MVIHIKDWLIILSITHSFQFRHFQLLVFMSWIDICIVTITAYSISRVAEIRELALSFYWEADFPEMNSRTILEISVWEN